MKQTKPEQLGKILYDALYLINFNSAQVLYWCDSKLGRIESVNTDGTNRRLLHVETGERFFGIVFLNDYLYLTSWSSG